MLSFSLVSEKCGEHGSGFFSKKSALASGFRMEHGEFTVKFGMPSLVIPRAIDHATYARPKRRPRAHGTGFERHIQGALIEEFPSEVFRR